MLDALDDAHARVTRPLLEAEQHAVRGEPGDGSATFAPARIQIVEPDVSDVAAEPLHEHAAGLGIAAEGARRGEALIEEDFVERRVIERPGLERLGPAL